MTIAFDAVGGTGWVVNPNPVTFSHTCSGSNRILFLIIAGSSGSQPASAPTYNGVAMTQIGTEQEISGMRTSIWYLVNPAEGTNTVSVTHGGGSGAIVTASYTGASQTGVPDSVGFNAGIVSSLTVTTTVVAENCWLWGGFNDIGGTITAGSGTTERHSVIGGDYEVSVTDSNGTVGTGSQSQTASDTAIVQGWAVSFAPAAEGGGAQMTADEGSVQFDHVDTW